MDIALEKEIYALLGFLLGLFAALFVERARNTRRRMALLRVVEWQLGAFIRASRWAAESKCWDSTDVESFARFLQETFLRQPDLILAARKDRTRTAIAQIYAEATGVLELLRLHRQQVAEGTMPTVFGPGLYEGLVKRCESTLRTLRRARWWLFFYG